MSTARTLSQWLSYFETLHPVGIDMGLGRVSRVWQHLCNAYDIESVANTIITVAGTNGKGSACCMLTTLLRSQGYTVGTYTSPHIHHFNERVHINDLPCGDELLCKAFAAIDKHRADISISYFEATTLAGLLTFAWSDLDYAVLEVGLGGRFDAINIIDADAALITSIGLDHQAFLGSDCSLIALEKAGIYRTGKPAVYAQTDIYQSILDYCRDENIPLIVRDRDYHIANNTVCVADSSITIPENIIALGQHQVSNYAGVIALLHSIQRLPHNADQTLETFSVAGRMQIISQAPDVIVDVAHNEPAAAALADYLQRHAQSYTGVYAVIGMLKDKDHAAVLEQFHGLFEHVYIGSSTGERGLSDRDLAHTAQAVLTCPVTPCGSLIDALEQARTHAQETDLIIAFGSFEVATTLIQPHHAIPYSQKLGHNVLS